jgi:peptide chain release factor 2
VTSALSRANSERERVTGMDSRVEDLEVLVEMGTEEGDADTLAEAERDLAKLKKDVGELEVRTLLNGEYDAREAVVTIRSGAGGVDAADFAEMLMRMYLRWAERHTVPVKVWTPPTPRRRASSRRPSRSTCPMPTATSPSRAAPTAWCGSARSTTRAAARRRFAAVEVVPLIEQTDHIDIPENELKIDVFRSSPAPAARASTPPTPPSA